MTTSSATLEKTRNRIVDSMDSAREDAARDGVTLDDRLDATARLALTWLYPELCGPRVFRLY